MKTAKRTALLLALLIAVSVLLCACNQSVDGEYRCTSYKYVNLETGSEQSESFHDFTMTVKGDSAVISGGGTEVDKWTVDQKNQTMTDQAGNTARYQMEKNTMTVTFDRDTNHKIIIVFEKQ